MVSPFSRETVCFTGPGLPNAAASRTVSLFHSSICFSLELHGSSLQVLFASSRVGGIHPTEAFQLLELSSNVCTGLSHRGSINHLLILGCLKVKLGVCSECFAQTFIEIGGLSSGLDYRSSFGHNGGLLASARNPCRRALR